MSDMQLVERFDEEGRRLGFLVANAPLVIEVQPQMIEHIPVDDEGCLVFEALNGTWRYRQEGTCPDGCLIARRVEVAGAS